MTEEKKEEFDPKFREIHVDLLSDLQTHLASQVEELEQEGRTLAKEKDDFERVFNLKVKLLQSKFAQAVGLQNKIVELKKTVEVKPD